MPGGVIHSTNDGHARAVIEKALRNCDQSLKQFGDILSEQWDVCRRHAARVVNAKAVIYWVFLVSVAAQIAVLLSPTKADWVVQAAETLPPLLICFSGFVLLLLAIHDTSSPGAIERFTERNAKLNAAVTNNFVQLPRQIEMSLSNQQNAEIGAMAALSLNLLEHLRKDVGFNVYDLSVSEHFIRRDMRDVANRIFGLASVYLVLSLPFATRAPFDPRPLRGLTVSDWQKAPDAVLQAFDWHYAAPVLLLMSTGVLWMFLIVATKRWRKQFKQFLEKGGSTADYESELFPKPSWSAVAQRNANENKSYGFRNFVRDISNGLAHRGAPQRGPIEWNFGAAQHYLHEFWPVARQVEEGNRALNFPNCIERARVEQGRQQKEEENKAARRAQAEQPAAQNTQPAVAVT